MSRRKPRFGEFASFEEHPTALPDPEVIDSPDGDPAKRGTITAAASLTHVGPIHLTPAPADHPARRNELVIVERGNGLSYASDLGAVVLDGLYEQERARDEALEAILDYQPRRRP